MTDLEYEDLIFYIRHICARDGIRKTDADDIAHDTIIRIYEDNVPKSEWKTLAFSMKGNWINQNKRRHTVAWEEAYE